MRFNARAPWLPPKTSSVGCWLLPRGQGEKRGPHRNSGYFKAAKPASGLREMNRGVRGKAGHRAVGVAGDHVRFKQHHRDAQQHRRNGRRTRRVAAHADHHLRLKAAQNAHRGKDRQW